MVEIVRVQEGPYLKVVTEDGATSYLGWSDLFNKIWDDYVRGIILYVRGIILNSYTRGILFDLGLTLHQVFHAMEQLQLGKSEYEAGDYIEVSYL
jgi:hypothetical protein